MVRAMVLEGPRRLVERQLPCCPVGEDDGLLRVVACGLCGTDHEHYTGALPTGFALVPGHETVGVVEALGPRAQRRWGVSAGDLVALEVFQSCRACPACDAGLYRRCQRHGIADTYGFIPVDRHPGLWGGYAQQQYLAPDTMMMAVPAGLDPVVATLFNPLGAGIRWGATLPGTAPGDVVAVLGPGVRGLSACAAAKEAGAGFVMVTGVSPADDQRLAMAREFGADLAVSANETDPAGVLRRETGEGADVVIDVTAKAPGALAQAVQMARVGGTVVLAGTRGSTQTPGFQPDLVVFKELRMLGALGVDTDAYHSALQLLAAGRYPFAEIPRASVALEKAEKLLATMAGETGAPRPIHGVLRP